MISSTMSQMVRRILLALLALIVVSLGGLAWMARRSFEKETKQIPLPWSAKAIEDDTLMLQRWLALRGHSARRAGGAVLRGELPAGGTLILMTLSHPLMESEVDLLMAWVREGGCLVVDSSAAPFNDGRGTKALLDRLGAVLENQAEGEGFDEGFASHSPQVFRVGEADYCLNCSREWRLRMKSNAADPQAPSELLLTLSEGQGHVLLLADTSFLRNPSFAELDHAAYLSRILGEAGVYAPRPVVVWSKEIELQLFPWLWQHAWPFLIACGVLLIAWLWAGLPRFGSLLPAATETRRSLLEHLEASGRFLWRRGGRESLLATSRAAVLRRAMRLHPGFEGLDEDEKHAFLAHRSALPQEDVASALIERPGLSPEEQAHYLQILHLLRQRITRIP